MPLCEKLKRGDGSLENGGRVRLKLKMLQVCKGVGFVFTGVELLWEGGNDVWKWGGLILVEKSVFWESCAQMVCVEGCAVVTLFLRLVTGGGGAKVFRRFSLFTCFVL